MARRVNVPKADELFRATAVSAVPGGMHPEGHPDIRVVEDGAEEGRSQQRAPSGRVRHDEKMTVYVTSDELLELEQARLVLRRALGSAVDRGRIVRAAVAMALEDLEANGDDSALVRRLARP